MPPYETKCLQRIFDTIGLSDIKLIGMIKAWLSDAIADTHFNDYDYTIMVGHELFNRGISRMFDNPMTRLSHILDKSRIKMQFCTDPLWDSGIKIEWRAPVYREDMGIDMKNLWKSYLESAHIPQIKKVIYNDPATIIFWADGTKTVVQCQPEDEYDSEKGLALAIAKKALGNTSRQLNDELHKWEMKDERAGRECKDCKHAKRSIAETQCRYCVYKRSHPYWEPKDKKEEK